MNKNSILVVEDEALIAASLVQTLTSIGYSVQKPVLITSKTHLKTRQTACLHWKLDYPAIRK